MVKWLCGLSLVATVAFGQAVTNVVAPFTMPPAAGGGFSPTDIAGLVGWWDANGSSVLYKDAAMTTEATANDDTVRAWKDKSDSSRHAIQVSSSAFAQLKTNQVNGRKAVFFGKPSQLRIAIGGSALSAFTFMMVLKIDSSANYAGPFAWDSAGVAGFGFYNDTDAQPNWTAHLTIYNGSSETSNQRPASGAITLPMSTFYCYIWTSTPALKVNGSASTLESGDSGFIVGQFIGGAQTTKCRFYVDQILVYNSVLSAGDITSLETWINGLDALW